jgi:hypothetical protein
MNDQPTATLTGDLVDSPIKKPPTRPEKIKAWKDEHRLAYKEACKAYECTCTPTRAQMLLREQWENPPID